MLFHSLKLQRVLVIWLSLHNKPPLNFNVVFFLKHKTIGSQLYGSAVWVGLTGGSSVVSPGVTLVTAVILCLPGLGWSTGRWPPWREVLAADKDDLVLFSMASHQGWCTWWLRAAFRGKSVGAVGALEAESQVSHGVTSSTCSWLFHSPSSRRGKRDSPADGRCFKVTLQRDVVLGMWG